MSRAVLINAATADVAAMCAKHNVAISTIEPLHSGGTRVVLLNGHDAAVIAKAYAKRILTGDVVRTPRAIRQGASFGSAADARPRREA
jgi:hypothetical protein